MVVKTPLEVALTSTDIGKKEGSAVTRTRVVGSKVQRANHYTTEPMFAIPDIPYLKPFKVIVELLFRLKSVQGAGRFAREVLPLKISKKLFPRGLGHFVARLFVAGLFVAEVKALAKAKARFKVGYQKSRLRKVPTRPRIGSDFFNPTR